MSLISSSIPNFVNGVSQQPYTLRLVSQGEVQENGLSTVSQGLKKRPPTKHLKKIQNTPLGNCFIHTINRDVSERYVAIVTNGDLKVYDINGVEQTVTFPNGKAYLNGASPSTSFSAVTVADYTFLVNKNITAATTNATTPTRPFEALVNVKAGNYGKTYAIKLNGATVASYTTPDGSNPAHTANISTDFIATQLFNVLLTTTQSVNSFAYQASNNYTAPGGSNQANVIQVQERTPIYEDDGLGNSSLVGYTAWFNKTVNWTSSTTFQMSPAGSSNAEYRIIWNGPGNYTVQRTGAVIYISRGEDFVINCEDGFNGGGMVAVKKRLQKFSDLPANPGVNGFVVEIAGTGSGETATSPFDSYYVRFDAEGTQAVGVWRECPAPGVKSTLNNATMPHLLVRQSDGTFKFQAATWKTRLVGDDESNPFPSFIGRQIADVFFYRNRLGLLADESVIFSESGQYFNFMRTTVTQLLDSDPIDVNASHTKVSVLKHAIPFNKQLLLFSEQTQFLVEQNDILSPKTIAIKVSTEFPCNINVKPVGVGKNVYFPANKGEWSSVREYFADVNSLTNDALDITAHLPQYVPADIFKFSTAVNEDIMVALSSRDPSSLYVYKYFFNNNEKLQSSWSKWTFGSDVSILNVDFIESDMYLVINRSDGVYLEKASVSLGDIGPGEPYTVNLDRKVQLVSGDVSFSSGHTVISLATLGYTPNVGEYQVVVKSHPTLKSGEIFPVIWDGTNAKVAGNITGGTYTFGRKYLFKYTLSTITVRSQTASGGSKSDSEGRLQLRKVAFNYDETGYFEVKVTPSGRETYNYVFSGKILGQTGSTLGALNLAEGRFKVPVVSQNIGTNITIENDSPLPSSILSADWEGFYVKRSKAI